MVTDEMWRGTVQLRNFSADLRSCATLDLYGCSIILAILNKAYSSKADTLADLTVPVASKDAIVNEAKSYSSDHACCLSIKHLVGVLVVPVRRRTLPHNLEKSETVLSDGRGLSLLKPRADFK